MPDHHKQAHTTTWGSVENLHIGKMTTSPQSQDQRMCKEHVMTAWTSIKMLVSSQTHEIALLSQTHEIALPSQTHEMADLNIAFSLQLFCLDLTQHWTI